MKKTILYIMASLFIFGCSQRLGDFSIMSTKNVDIGANYVKVEKNVQGKDMKPIYVVFPTGYPSIESAIDDALKKVNDSVIMTDVVLTYRYFYIPYDDFDILFKSKYVMTDYIEGIPNNRYWKHLIPHIQQ